MTKDEYKEKLEALQAEYEQKERALQAEFAYSRSIAKVGDLVKGQGAVIKVQSIEVAYWLEYPECVYHGLHYTSKGVPAKVQHVSQRRQSQITHVNGNAIDLF